VATACTILTSVVTGGMGRIGDGFLEGFNTGEFWYVLKILHVTGFALGRYIVMILFTVFGVLTVLTAPNALHVTKTIKRTVPQGILLGILFIWCVLSLSGVSTFLYFNF
jgi:amino acid transporter